MINKIGIENFRVFKDYTEFQLGPITILTGPNNSGKSSFLKLLSLLQYSFKSDGGLNFLNFDGGNHNLGNYDKVTNWKNNSKQVKIITDFSLNYFDEKFKLELIYIPDNDNGKLISFKIFNNKRILLNYFSSYAGSDFDVIQSPSKSLYNYYSLQFPLQASFLILIPRPKFRAPGNQRKVLSLFQGTIWRSHLSQNRRLTIHMADPTKLMEKQ